MKDLFNAVLRLLVKLALHGYFKKIIITGKENLPKNRPVILVANHQNALIDPLLLATHTRLNPYFLTRASAFKNPIAAKLLSYIRMLPVYRVRDGFSTIQQNQQTFEQTYEVLSKNGCVIIFAEGSHSLVRNVRPLSKGFTRMAFGLLEKYPAAKPVILPVGLDFSAHKRSGSIARITFGECIPVDMTPAQSGKLTKKVEIALKSLVVDIPDEKYQDSLHELLEKGVDVSSKRDVDRYLSSGEVSSQVKEVGSLSNKVMKIFHLPLYWLWLWIEPKVKDEVFTSTWKFLIGFVLAVPYYLFIFSLSFIPPFGTWALAFLFMAWISVWRNQNNQE